MEKHERPFRCAVEGCPTVVLGLTTQKDLEKHMKDTHGFADKADEFPAENELAPTEEVQRPVRVQQETRRREKKVYSCGHCSKIFSKNYNLKSHLATHQSERPYSCSFCNASFARASDCNRHESSHNGNGYTCAGCGKKFTRSDSLNNHHKSKAGQKCIFPSFTDRGLEQGNSEQSNTRTQNEM